MASLDVDPEELAAFVEQFALVRRTMDEVAGSAFEAATALPPIEGQRGQKLINALTKLANDWDELARRRDAILGGLSS